MSVVSHLEDTATGELEQNDPSTLLMEVETKQNEQLRDVDEEQCNDDNNSPIVDGENVCMQSSSELGNNSYVVKVPRANSKLILQNMEEVLNSVKKKHRQKHRRKKEQKKLAMLAEAELEKAEQLVATTNGGNASSTSKVISNNDCRGNKFLKKPLQEQQAVQDQSIPSIHIGKGKHNNSKRRKASAVPNEADLSSNSILDHLVRTPRKNIVQENTNQNPVQENINVPQKSTPTIKPATNAFEVMMNARNKSIGSNTPGKDVNTTDEYPAGSNTVNAKRKILLQSWADRKGALKRKLDEEMRATYVEERLDARAKRLKKMLTSGGSPRGSSTAKASTSETDLKNDMKKQAGSVTNSKSKGRPKTSTRRSRRLSSSDSVELTMENPTTSFDPETEEFLSKLSSPSKKRDSLLGYFSKIHSPNDVDASTPTTSIVALNTKKQQNSTKMNSETSKRRGRYSKAATNNLLDVENIDTQVLQAQNGTPASRPKRACAERAKYDYDLEREESPKKEQQKISKTSMKHSTDDCKEIVSDEQRRSKRKQRQHPIQTIDSINHDDDDETLIINLDSSTSFSVSHEIKTPKKLAPLFVRSMPKPSLDPETLKARQEFLRSGVPDKLKLEQDKQKLFEQNYEEALELFPKISHLQQWSCVDEKFLTETTTTTSSSKNFRFKNEQVDIKNDIYSETNCRSSCSNRKAKITKSRNSLNGITNCIARDFRHDKKSMKCTNDQLLLASLPIVANKRLVIKAWKSDFERFPTFKCYNQLRTKYRFFSALDSTQDTQQVTESFVVTRTTRRSLEAASISQSTQQRNADLSLEEDVKPPATAPNGELLFTEKYKPLLFEQVLVNLTPVSQLRDFLANWSNGSGKNSQNLGDDSMDFMNDSNSSQQATCNSVVLLGPASSGKTNAVFTLANEMNFNVLEINAGMKRTGKKLIQELLEATQSHQIRNESTGGSAIKSKAQKNLLKMSLSSLKGRKQTGSNNNNSAANEAELSAVTDLNVRKSLILIEDADIVFEQTDAGFTDAVYTLAASSKRPVIVVATNPNCQHLQRLMTQNTIKFSAPNALSISKYLAILSLMENCPVSLDDLISLYLYNQNDLRKTLHELQFFIQSGGDRKALSKPKTAAAAEKSEKSIPTQQQRTPQKETESEENHKTGKYFASPGKCRLSEDTLSLSLSGAVNDEQLKRETQQQQQQQQQTNQEQELYVHRTLFEFYTIDQNAKWRIPFPVNFDLFYVNLNEIFSVAKKLRLQEEKAAITKRKTRSPKKVWLSTATATATAAEADTVTVTDIEKCRNSQTFESLEALSSFYNNVSIAISIVSHDNSLGNAVIESHHERDRLMPYLSESIAHDLLENAININLEADLCPYNLFEEQKKSTTLSDLMFPTMATFSKRARFIDCEPALRAICRSEQQRAAQERRSTRFYHYLRNSCVDICNFSQQPFDGVCSVFQTQQKLAEDQQTSEQHQQQQQREALGKVSRH